MAARPLRHDAVPQDVVVSVPAVAGRQSPVLGAGDGVEAKRAREAEDSAELSGLEPAHRVRRSLLPAMTGTPHLRTMQDRIEAALSYRNVGT
ncbi:hypothetical protein ACWGCI_10250 [Streptomyces sp. NPDC054949]